MSTIARAFTTDDRYDRESASDKHSRYGAYLAQHSRLFDDEGTPTAQLDWFAFSAWEVANSPIMSPGYVRTHPRVLDTAPHWDEDGRPALTVRLAAPLPRCVPDLMGRDVNTWDTPRDIDGGIRAWMEPWDNDTVSAFATLTVRVPVNTGVLPTPSYHRGAPDVATAKHAIRVLCTTANTIVNGLCVALDHSRDGQ
jgi:hypothetical protein